MKQNVLIGDWCTSPALTRTNTKDQHTRPAPRALGQYFPPRRPDARSTTAPTQTAVQKRKKKKNTTKRNKRKTNEMPVSTPSSSLGKRSTSGRQPDVRMFVQTGRCFVFAARTVGTYPLKDPEGVRRPPLGNQPSRRFGHQGEAPEDKNGWQHADADHGTPFPRI